MEQVTAMKAAIEGGELMWCRWRNSLPWPATMNHGWFGQHPAMAILLPAVWLHPWSRFSIPCVFSWQVTMTAFLIWGFWLDSHCSVAWGSWNFVARFIIVMIYQQPSKLYFTDALQLEIPFGMLQLCGYQQDFKKLRVPAPKTQRKLQLGSIGLGYEPQQHIVRSKRTRQPQRKATRHRFTLSIPDACQGMDFQGFSFYSNYQ